MKLFKKIFTIFYFFSLFALNNCIQSTTSLLAPAIAGARTGNFYNSGLSYASTNIIKNQFGKTPSEYIKKFLTHNSDIGKTSLTTNKIKKKSKKISMNLKDENIEFNSFVSAVKKLLK